MNIVNVYSRWSRTGTAPFLKFLCGYQDVYHAPQYWRLGSWTCAAWFSTQLWTVGGGGGFG